MITKLSREDLVALGARYRANYVIAQGRYTLGLVAQDPEAASLAGTDFVAEIETALGRLEQAVKDRDTAAVEAKAAAHAQGDAVQAAKLWRRSLIERALAARLRGADIPEELGRTNARGNNPVALARDLERLTSLARQNSAALAPVGVTAELLDTGANLARALASADQKQELARLSTLPKKVQDMYEQKALVYLGCKQLNHLGRSAHTGDEHASGRYSLDILYRRVRRPAPGTLEEQTQG